MSVQIAGLSSGFNWQTIINELIQADSAGQNVVKAQQTGVNNQVTALGAISSDLTNLSNSVFSLEDPSLYSAVTVSSNNPTTTWQSNAQVGTAPGSYTIAVTTLATASQLAGASAISNGLNASNDVSALTVANLATAQPVTAGNFSVNGHEVAITTSESLAAVFTAISTATSGIVTAAYNSGTDRVTLTSSAGPVVLGAANDSSNFLQAMKLLNNGTATVSSATPVGALVSRNPLASAGIRTALAGQSGAGAGSFMINGVSISYNVTTDSLTTLMGRINNSGAGVAASYDSTNNRMLLTNTSTGSLGMGVSDTTGNLMAALGLTSGAGAILTQGLNAQFTVNGGPTQTSLSNDLSPVALGVPGLDVTVNTRNDTQTITVAANTAGIQSAIQGFITSFNAMQTAITGDTAIGTGSGGAVTTSILSSDHEVRDWGRSLEMTAFSAGKTLTGSIKSLDSLGIDFSGTTGQLVIADQGKLLQALSQNTNAVAAFFQSGATGFGAEMNAAITDVLGQNRSDQTNLNQESASLALQITTMQAQLDAEKAKLEAEFTAMETLSSQYQAETASLNSLSGTGSSTSASTASSINSSNVFVNGSNITSSGSTSGTGK